MLADGRHRVAQRRRSRQEAVDLRGEPLHRVSEARALPAEGLGAVQQPLNVRTRSVLHVPSQLALLKAQRADGLSVGMRSGKLHRG